MHLKRIIQFTNSNVIKISDLWLNNATDNYFIRSSRLIKKITKPQESVSKAAAASASPDRHRGRLANQTISLHSPHPLIAGV